MVDSENPCPKKTNKSEDKQNDDSKSQDSSDIESNEKNEELGADVKPSATKGELIDKLRDQDDQHSISDKEVNGLS